MINMSFGSRIKDLRKEMNLSQSDFGKRVNVSGTTISQYESDQRFPTQETLINICRLTDTSSDYLLGLSSMKSPSLEEGKVVIDCNGFTKEQLNAIELLVRAFSSKKDKRN